MIEFPYDVHSSLGSPWNAVVSRRCPNEALRLQPEPQKGSGRLEQLVRRCPGGRCRLFHLLACDLDQHPQCPVHGLGIVEYGRYIGPTPITEYGCVLCQKYHRKGLDPEYEAHLYHQSKHGVSERKPNGAAEEFVAHLLAARAQVGYSVAFRTTAD